MSRTTECLSCVHQDNKLGHVYFLHRDPWKIQQMDPLSQRSQCGFAKLHPDSRCFTSAGGIHTNPGQGEIRLTFTLALLAPQQMRELLRVNPCIQSLKTFRGK
jgi:hypothetical protein